MVFQFNLIKGPLEEHEFFSEVLLGIKQVISTHMKEIQVKFQDKFVNMEQEVKKRDDIISKLQNRIQELESSQDEEKENGIIEERQDSSGTGSSGSSNELPFMVSLYSI